MYLCMCRRGYFSVCEINGCTLVETSSDNNQMEFYSYLSESNSNHDTRKEYKQACCVSYFYHICLEFAQRKHTFSNESIFLYFLNNMFLECNSFFYSLDSNISDISCSIVIFNRE